MAVLGFQLVLTIILLSVLNKISGKYSLARWLLSRGALTRFKHPTDQKLRDAINDMNKSPSDSNSANSGSLNNSNKNQSKARKRGKNWTDDGASGKNKFVVPQNLALELESEPVSLLHLVNLPYYSELQWLIDFSACTVFVYFSTEAYYFMLPDRANKELNLSIVWCLLALLNSAKCLLTITGMMFRQKDERSLIISFFCAFFLLSMVVLIPNESFLEFGLVDAYKSFNEKAIKLIESTGSLDTAYGPISFLIFRFWLAITCGLLGAFFVYPGLRMGKMQIDALYYANDRRFPAFWKAAYHVSFLAPLFAVVLWMKPVARHYLTVREWPERGVLMSDEMFESVRLLFILFVVFFRLSLFRHYLQAFLNIAPQKLTILKKDTNKIMNVDLQKQIASVTYYLCVAALQFLTPLFIILFVTLLTKSSGNYTWTGSYFDAGRNGLQSSRADSLTSQTIIENPANSSADSVMDSATILEESVKKFEELNAEKENSEKDAETVKVEDKEDFKEDGDKEKLKEAEDKAEDKEDGLGSKAHLELLKDVFNVVVLRGLNNFGLWWMIAVWFTTCTLGYVYHNQFGSFL